MGSNCFALVENTCVLVVPSPGGPAIGFSVTPCAGFQLVQNRRGVESQLGWAGR